METSEICMLSRVQKILFPKITFHMIWCVIFKGGLAHNLRAVCCTLEALTSAIVSIATEQQPMSGQVSSSPISCHPVAMKTIALVSASSVQQTALGNS